MKKLLLLTIVLFSGLAFAQEVKPEKTTRKHDDEAAIRATALNYVEGRYEGNPERMKAALHPDLAKRNVHIDKTTHENKVENMGAEKLVELTGQGLGGKLHPVSSGKKSKSKTASGISPSSVPTCAIGWTSCSC